MNGKTDSHKKNRESLIFDAALIIIKQKGFHKARMADIAREAGGDFCKPLKF